MSGRPKDRIDRLIREYDHLLFSKGIAASAARREQLLTQVRRITAAREQRRRPRRPRRR